MLCKYCAEQKAREDSIFCDHCRRLFLRYAGEALGVIDFTVNDLSNDEVEDLEWTWLDISDGGYGEKEMMAFHYHIGDIENDLILNHWDEIPDDEEAYGAGVF